MREEGENKKIINMVLGGELKKIEYIELREIKKIDIVGI